MYNSNTIILENKKGKKEVYSTKTDEEIQIPLVILVNEKSASGSEVLSSMVRDVGKEIIVGNTTYGKGVAQSHFELKGHGSINIVKYNYFTKSRVIIQGNGLKPDSYSMPLDKYKGIMYIPYEEDVELQKAIETIYNK